MIRKRIDTEAHKGYAHIASQIVRLVRELEAETGFKAEKIGVGTPGTVEPSTGIMKNCNTTCLNDMPLRRDLMSMLGIPVEIANDATCFALAEAVMGIVPYVVPTFNCVFCVIMGTGVGGGVVLKGKYGQAFVLNLSLIHI